MTKPQAKPQATLFLHTDDIAEDVRDQMVAAGYLPLKVSSLAAYSTISHQVSLSRDQLDAIAAAALGALATHGTPAAKESFTYRLAAALGLKTNA